MIRAMKLQQGGLFYGYTKKTERALILPHGPGAMLYEKGMKYFGMFADGKREGFGRAEFVKNENDGEWDEYFEGEFKDSLRHGKDCK